MSELRRTTILFIRVIGFSSRFQTSCAIFGSTACSLFAESLRENRNVSSNSASETANIVPNLGVFTGSMDRDTTGEISTTSAAHITLTSVVDSGCESGTYGKMLIRRMRHKYVVSFCVLRRWKRIEREFIIDGRGQ